MDLQTQKIFLKSALEFAISGTLNLSNEQLINMYEECSVMAENLQDINSFVLAHQRFAALSYKLSRFDKAIRSNNILLSIFHRIGDKEQEGYAYGNLGICHRSLGHYDKAVNYNEMSLNIAKQIGEKATEGKAYGNLGVCYSSLGQYDKAVNHHEMHLNIAKQIGEKAAEGKAYGSLGNCYRLLGKYDKAVTHHEMCLNIAKQIGDKEGEGKAHCNLGICYCSLGQYDKALNHYEMSLNIAKQIEDKAAEGEVYCNLGGCYRSLGQCDKAVNHHKMSLNILKQIGAKAKEAKVYGSLGSSYFSLGQYDKAVNHYEMSLNIAKQIGNKDEEAHAYYNLGRCYVSLGQYDKAVNNHEMSLNIAKQIGNNKIEGVAYGYLGICYCSFKQYDKAVCSWKEALKRFEDLFQNTPKKDELNISVRGQFSLFNRLLVNVLIMQHKTNEAFVFCERGRARALVDLLHFKYFLYDKKPEENLLNLAALRTLVASLQSTILYFALDNDCVYIWIIQQNGSIRFRKSSLPSQREYQSPNNVSSSFFKQLNAIISELRSSCRPIDCEDRSLLVLKLKTEIEQNDERRCPKLCSFSVVSKTEAGKNVLAKECTTESCDKDILTRNIEEKEDVETRPLQTLYQILLAPVQDHIEGKEVIIVPEGLLHLVPFAALKDEDGHYVAESLRVRIFPSLTTAKMILETEVKSIDQMKPLIVGDPDTGYLPRLPCANEEARVVAKLFKTERLIGGEATKEKVLLSIENASLIHIAAHGDMEKGEIALARKPSGASTSTESKKDNNMLMMTDLEHKWLKAKLVVLSCCHSASGNITSDGVVGIARAFLAAGARSVLVALWAINDDATLYFMERFYKHLTQGKSAGEALSEAMAAMRASGLYNDPRHWAPFVLIGDDVSVC